MVLMISFLCILEFLTDTFVLLQSMVFTLYFCVVAVQVLNEKVLLCQKGRYVLIILHIFRLSFRWLCKNTLIAESLKLVCSTWEQAWLP